MPGCSAREARPGNSGGSHRMRSQARRVGWAADRRPANPGGTLGCGLSDREGQTHPSGSDAGVGETSRRRLDAGCRDNGRLHFPHLEQKRQDLGDHITPKAKWHMVKGAARRIGIANLAPHDLRRSCARLCHLAGGELEQIQFLLGHVSVQTTERYLGCKQELRNAVNDGIDVAEV